MKIVQVDWIDSKMNGGWASRKEYMEKTNTPAVCRSVGYLLRSDKSHLTLVQSLDDRDGMSDAVTIPRSAIRRTRVIRA